MESERVYRRLSWLSFCVGLSTIEETDVKTVSKKVRIVFALSFAFVLGMCTWRVLNSPSPEPKEPSLHGRTLTEWIVESATAYANFRGPKGTDPRNQTARNSVKTIGTNGIPTLLKMLQAKDAPLKARLISWANQGRTPIHFRDAKETQSLAHDGFAILGKDAADATPGLIRLARDTDPKVSHRALFCLPLVNPDKESLLPILTRIIHDPAFHIIQLNAASLLRGSYPDEAEAAGVYDAFPAFRPNSPRQIHAEGFDKEGVK